MTSLVSLGQRSGISPSTLANIRVTATGGTASRALGDWLANPTKGDVANNILYPGVDYSLPWAFGAGTAAAVNGAMEKCATAGGGTVLLPAVDIPDDATIDNKYPKVLLASVADGARYVNSGTGVYACRLIPTFVGTVLKHRTPYAAELGAAVNQYFGGGFKGISVKGNGVATRLLDIDTVSGGYYDLYLEDSVGPDCARLYCGRSSIDVLGPSDIQFMPMCRLFIRQLGSGAPRLADCVVFDNINTGNVSLNFNIFLDIQHYDGDALDIISGDNNHIWLRADNAGGTGKAVVMRGPTASHIVGGDSNTFKYLVASSDGGIVAEGTDTGGVTAGVVNVIESLDVGNGSPIPVAGTGSVWRTRTNFGGDFNLAAGHVVIAKTEATARAQRALMPSTRSLVIHNDASDHIRITNGTESYDVNIDGTNGDLRLFRVAGSGHFKLSLDAIPNHRIDATAAAASFPLWDVYRKGEYMKIRTGVPSTDNSPLEDLVQLALQAKISNPRINPVMSAPPTLALSTEWAQSRVYLANEYCVTFQGSGTSQKAYLYQTSAGGTSAGSGSGPQTTTPSADNTVTWTYITNLPCRQFAQNSAANSYLWNDNTGLAKSGGPVLYLDGVPTNDASTHACKMFINTVAGAVHNGGGRFRFVADSTAFVVRLFHSATGTGERVIVDGQYASLSRLTSIRAGWMYLFLIFGSRARRDITIESDDSTYLAGVDVGVTEGVYRPGEDKPLTLINTGDSLMTNAGTTYQYDSSFKIMADLLGARSASASAIGGTGLLVSTPSGGALSRISDVTSAAAYFTNSVIIEANGFNDVAGFTAGQIQAAELAYLQALRAALPTTPIIVLGIWPGLQGGTPAGSTWTAGLAAEDAKSAAVAAMNDPLIVFVPILRASGGPPITGTGNDGAAAGNGNADVFINGASTPHPNTAGHLFYAQWLANAILRAVKTMIDSW